MMLHQEGSQLDRKVTSQDCPTMTTYSNLELGGDKAGGEGEERGEEEWVTKQLKELPVS